MDEKELSSSFADLIQFKDGGMIDKGKLVGDILKVQLILLWNMKTVPMFFWHRWQNMLPSAYNVGLCTISCYFSKKDNGM